MLNIVDLKEEQATPAILRLGFRPLFLSAAMFAVLAILIWMAVLTSSIQIALYKGGFWWHGHEMLFGFACAVVVGFLLTAVQTWTGQPGVKGSALFTLWVTWLIPRILMVFSDVIPANLIIISDILFLPFAAFLLARPIVAVRQYRNLFFVPVLLMLTAINIIMHLADSQSIVSNVVYLGILLITVVMLVMGGRVIPFFTANGTQTTKRPQWKWLERISLGSAWCLVVVFALGWPANDLYRDGIGVLCFISGVANLVRFGRWNFHKTLRVPLLWSLQLSYVFIPITFLLMSVHFSMDQFYLGSLMHGLTAGAMGSMIIAMMARVSLGHTGRNLVVPSLMSSAFLAVLVAGAVRLLGTVISPEYYLLSLKISSGLWVFGFTVFVVKYFPILTSPRVDGRPG